MACTCPHMPARCCSRPWRTPMRSNMPTIDALASARANSAISRPSAIVLAMIALLSGYEAFARLLQPVAISFNEAIPIAVLGLAVNVVSAWVLSGGHQGAHHHAHPHDHAHAHDDHDQQEHEHDHGHEHGHGHGAHHRDNNMRAAVVHVMA